MHWAVAPAGLPEDAVADALGAAVGAAEATIAGAGAFTADLQAVLLALPGLVQS